MKNVLRRVGANFWVYCLWIFVIIILWNGVFDVLTGIPAEEKIVVFVASYDKFFPEGNHLQQDLPDGIKMVDIHLRAPTTMYFDAYLAIYGYLQGDILILPESVAQKVLFPEYFSEISEKHLQELPHLDVWQEAGKAYGLKIYDCDSHQSVISGLNFGQDKQEENYYLFFGLNSVHLGDLSNGSTGVTDSGAIIIARRLLSQ